ncbi:urease accessory protein UreE [Aerococcus urinaehominis]|uniref:Urease accessory protein UreE n=1 Tax=Aerococcus urinaehominis TaxID=128944 RepID=A0A0X8FMD1_9LACT|nr:urease accessory protein UreE [Aerococcus urinaehominis]AMB99935.1 urease accessory protein UreE [Aerococcus urinaehominis]SDM42832.1 urease accessory protein [Aerococcus urinaehominis]
MLITEIQGNLRDKSGSDHKHQELVYVENENLARRLHHLTTDHGNEITVKLSRGDHLHVDDILFEDDNNRIVVKVLEEDCIVIRPTSIHDMGIIAHNLGNRHLPAQFMDDAMLVQYDYLVAELLDKEGIPFTREKINLPEPFRHVDHRHV